MTSEQYIKRIERMAAEMRRLETTNRQLQEENRQLSGGGDSVLMAPRDLCSPRSDATKSPQSVVQSPRGEQRRLEEVNAAYSVKLQQLRQAERQSLHKTKELEAELATVQNQLVEANAARSRSPSLCSPWFLR